MSFTTTSHDSISQWNDATIYGDLNTPETQLLLDRHFDVLVGATSKQRRGNWLLWSTSLREMIETKFSHHEVRSKKDGHATVFAKSIITEEAIGNVKEWDPFLRCGRTREDIEAVTFAGFDIDDGDALEIAIERLEKLGYFAILYTTHSHGKARSEFSNEAVDKYRILFPLEEPFLLSNDDPVEHEQRCLEWRERLVNFAEHVLDLVIDESGCDVNRLFYTPRHKPSDDNWYLGIFAGRALCVDDMPYFPTTVRPRQRRGRRTGNDLSMSYTVKRPILSDGFDLIDWQRDWGTWFLVRDFFDVLQWDFGSDLKARREARILCPNDHAHSSFDDVMGCWIKDGSGTTPFVIYCHHDACREMGTLEQLIELEQFAPLPDGFETLSELLCSPFLYTCYLNDDDGESPDRHRYLRWDPREPAPVTDIDTTGEVTQ